MRTYELVETEFEVVIKATENDETYWIPMREGNRGYEEYLRYTEWVEAGNNPDEFWTQTELTEMGEEI